MHTHTIFVISDGTGITAETFGTAIMAQFDSKPRLIRIPLWTRWTRFIKPFVRLTMWQK